MTTKIMVDTGPSTRIDALDALRGIAAITVVNHHIMCISPEVWSASNGGSAPLWAQILVHTPLHWLWGGYEAVLVFFVMSGLVLSLPFYQARQVGYFQFLIKRIWRIYPAVFFAVTVSTLASLFAPDSPAYVSKWFSIWWREPFSVSRFILELGLIGHDGLDTDAPLWSLVHEVRVSVIFPLCIAFMLRFRRCSFCFFFIVSMLSAYGATYFSENHTLRSLFETGRYLWTFMLGAEIGFHLNSLKVTFRRFSSSVIICFLISSLIILHGRWIPGLPKIFGSLFMCIGAGGLVLLIATRPPLLLSTSIFRFFGKVSYSIYLLHFPIILLAVKLFPSNSLWWLSPICAVPIVFLLAYSVYIWIEVPGISFGRQIISKMGIGQIANV